MCKDLFGGIGSAIVALKRNQIGIAKIVHVHHDQVATHVHQWHHDPLYHSTARSYNDGIEYISKSFHLEDMDQKLGDLIHEFGREFENIKTKDLMFVKAFCLKTLSRFYTCFFFKFFGNIKHLTSLLDVNREFIFPQMKQLLNKKK